jgi:dTDP-glucose 4,6-dehydratase
LVLETTGADKSLVTYKQAEPFTTKVKKMDFSKAVKDLNHDPQVVPREGIKRTVEWMKWFYRI